MSDILNTVKLGGCTWLGVLGLVPVVFGPFSINQHLLRSVMSATLGLLVERYTKELYTSHGMYCTRLKLAVAAVCEINPGRGGIAPRDSYHEAGKDNEQANQARRLMTRYHVGRTDSESFNFTR